MSELDGDYRMIGDRLVRLCENNGLRDANSVDGCIGRIINNPDKLRVQNNPIWIEPRKGDYIRIVSWDSQSYVQECVRLSKLDYLTVKRVIPEVIGIGNNVYCWAYRVEVEETDYNIQFMQWNYKIVL